MPGRAALVLAGILLVSGCAERDLWPAERVDPKTAVNITSMTEQWIYSRDVPMLAANVRDYLSLGVVETNRAGTRSYWLGVITWSTIDRSMLGETAPRARQTSVRLGMPDDSLELQTVPGGRQEIGASGTILAAPQPVYEDAWYRLGEEQLARLAKSPPATVSLVMDDGTVTAYDAWQVNRRALDRFLQATGFTPVDP
ncbi:MAG: hypothetical protein WAW79_00410 [Steroidobacteraceae bacterium]